MSLFFQGGSGRGCGWWSAVAAVGLCWAGAGSAGATARVRVEVARRSPWDAAFEARQRFEAEPAATHTRQEYAEVMDGFRAIYHGDPGDAHAARAVAQVAELLAEEGHEFGDAKSLHDAAGQYEYLAKAYPGGSMAPRALEQALELLGPADAAEARRVRAELAEDYPRYGPARSPARTASVEGSRIAGGVAGEAAGLSAPSAQPPHSGKDRPMGTPVRADSGRDDRFVGVKSADSGRDDRFVGVKSADSGRDDRFVGVKSADSGRDDRFVGVKSADSGRDDRFVGVKSADSGRDDRLVGVGSSDAGRDDRLVGVRSGDAGRIDAAGATRNAVPVVREAADAGGVIPSVPEKEQAGPLSVVTGIRHWSTASYTRVAIDLAVDPETIRSGEEVRYEAARVEDPDRIFFDLHHTRLAPQLAGKSFTVTDDGFLMRIRAAQFSDDVTRVVLDVHQVAEYSAFLLPNPTRLIIDIHGKAAAPNREDAAADQAQVAVEANTGVSPLRPAASGREDGSIAGRETGGTAEVSSLPPMPVTDGSAGFGLPVRSAEAARTERLVARPRVVISSKPTAARPVPNTVTRSSKDTGVEVAEVSDQPGMVEATPRPTSKPISSGIRDQGLGIRRRGRDAVAAAPAEAPLPTADGETSLTRALGLKIGRIVIDAGHGGHDSGTLGVGGIEEKNVVLDVALRLGKLLHDRLGADVVYTRADDTFIPLETRTAIANKAQADLFISVHANSSPDPSARGVEVYYLNFTSDPDAMRVASRENAVSTESVHELSDLVKKIALRDKIDESRELASDVDASLYAGLRRGNPGLKDRGVKKAPFVVLIGANMPSILAEISFVTNPTDAAKLETPAYRERVAESLYRGIARYADGVNGVRPRTRTVEQASSSYADGGN